MSRKLYDSSHPDKYPLQVRPFDIMDPEDPYECSECLEPFFMFSDACRHFYHCHHTPGVKVVQGIHQRSDRDDTVKRYNWVKEEFEDYPDNWSETKQRIFERDNYSCLECGRKNGLSVDHIVPLSKGGSNEDSNLQTLCWWCHSEKHPHLKNKYKKK